VSTNEAYFASRAMQALEVLAFGPATATQLADELRIDQRTARRLLLRMVGDGWLTRREGARPTYRPTLRIIALAAQLAQRTPLVLHASALAGDLQARVGDTVHLAVPSYRSALRLVRITGADDGAPGLRDLAPANAIAAGKLLLAFRERWGEAVLAAPLATVTERTIAHPAVLRRELARVRERGYATEDREYCSDGRAIAMPVRDHGSEVIAALALSAKTPLAELLERGDAVRDTADELSRRLAEDAA
jgi:IclR family transcriptional regulator, acetate operon repressor